MGSTSRHATYVVEGAIFGLASVGGFFVLLRWYGLYARPYSLELVFIGGLVVLVGIFAGLFRRAVGTPEPALHFAVFLVMIIVGPFFAPAQILAYVLLGMLVAIRCGVYAEEKYGGELPGETPARS